MKSQILLITFLSIVVLTGCKNAPNREETISNPNECTAYACPMHPDKTSTSPAKCPECNMDMEPVEKNARNDSAITKPGHN